MIQFIIMQKQCSICRQNFNKNTKVPVLFCMNNHIFCLSCVIQIMHQLQISKRCPMCRQIIKHDAIRKFPQYLEYISQLQQVKVKMKSQSTSLIQSISNIKQQASISIQNYQNSKLILTNLINFYKQQFKQNFLNQILKYIPIMSLIQSKSYDLAINILQILIQQYPDNSYQNFLGIGNKQQQKGFSQKQGIQKYKQYYKINNICLLDIINYIYLKYINHHNIYQSQIQWYQKLILLNQQNLYFIFSIALSSHNHSQYNHAVEYYSKCISIQPTFAKTYLMLAYIYFQQDHKLSLFNIKKCIQIQPTNIFAQYIQIILSRQNIKNKLQILLSYYPTYVRVLNHLGNLQFNQEKYQNALNIYQSCCQINNQFIEPLISIGKIMIEQSKEFQAIRIFRSIIKTRQHTSSFSECYFYLGNALQNIGNPQQATKYYNKCLKQNPNHLMANLNLGDIYFHTQNYKSALPHYILVKQDSYNCRQQFHRKMYVCYFENKKIKQSIQQLKKCLLFNASNEQIHGYLSDRYFEIKLYEQSIASAKICIQQGYKINHFYIRIIQHLQKIHNYRQALKISTQYMHKYQLTSEQYQNVLNIATRINRKQRITRR